MSMPKTRREAGWWGLVVGLLCAAECAAAAEAPQLRYGFQKDQKYGYDIKITAEIQDIHETRSGVIVWATTSAAADQFDVKALGNLKTERKGAVGRRPSFMFPPFAHRLGRFGVLQPTDWIISRQGEVIVVGRITQIPLLLGPEQLLIFEPLPTEAKDHWETVNGVGVLEKSAASRTPAGPPNVAREIGHGAEERVEYTVLETTADIVRIGKKYRLTTAPVASGGTQFTMTGAGELAFDRKLGVFKTNAMKYDIQVTDKNLKLNVPVTLDYRLLTAGELAAHEKEVQEAAAAAAEAKRPKAVDAEEWTQLRADLGAHDDKKAKAAMERLAHGIADDKAEEISAALLPFLKSPNSFVRGQAAEALQVWATPKMEAALIKASTDDSFVVFRPAVAALGRIATPAAAEAAAAQLPRARGEAGKALCAMGPVAEKATIPWLSDRDFWVRAEARNVIKAIGGPSSIEALQKLQSQGRETNAVKETIAAVESRLAETGQDAGAQPAAAKTDGLRTWRDASGTFEVRAVMTATADGKVTLKKEDGRTVNVPLDKLSAEDQTWVQEHAAAKPVNPFE